MHGFWTRYAGNVLVNLIDHCPPQMLPLLKRTTDNLVAVVGEKAASQESFEVLRYNNSIITTLVTIVNTSMAWLEYIIIIIYAVLYPWSTGTLLALNSLC